MSLYNRVANADNRYQRQHKFKRVLCVCSAGLLRSPTAALVLSQDPFNFNTRAAGVFADFALVPVDSVLLHWADEIVCMTRDHAEAIAKMTMVDLGKPVIVLDVPDTHSYRDEELMRIIRESYEERTK